MYVTEVNVLFLVRISNLKYAIITMIWFEVILCHTINYKISDDYVNKFTRQSCKKKIVIILPVLVKGNIQNAPFFLEKYDIMLLVLHQLHFKGTGYKSVGLCKTTKRKDQLHIS